MIPFNIKPIRPIRRNETLLEGVARKVRLLDYEIKLIRKHDGRQALLVVEPLKRAKKPRKPKAKPAGGVGGDQEPGNNKGGDQ